MREDRRDFLRSSSAMVAATAVWTTAGAINTSPVSREMGRRLSYLTPPAGSPPDLLARPSPPVSPFKTLDLEEFRPPVARPLFEISEAEGQALNDEEWFALFRERFLEVAERLRTDGFLLPGPWTVRGEEQETVAGGETIRIDIGDLPDPASHQRFFEFRPRKFYINREVEFRWKFHEQYGEDSFSWGYHNIYVDPQTGTFHATRPCSPGPTFHAFYGEPILVRRVNDLPEIGGQEGHAKLSFALPSSTSHLHNAHTASESDGFPNDWINPGEYWDHHYANFPSGNDDREKLSTLWYHDHRMDFTASNVYAGLDGFYLLFDEQDAHNADAPDAHKTDPNSPGEDESWWLPSHDYDIPLIFHDLLFAQGKDGKAVDFAREQTTRWTFESKQDWDDYAGSDRGDLTSEGVRKAIAFKGFAGAGANYEPSPQIIFDGFNTDGIIGDRWTVNRRIQPSLEVEPRKYRLRLLNGGPSRFYELFLHAKDAPAETYRSYTRQGEAQPTTELDHPFIVICGDGNFQPNPVLAHSIYLGVAQRVDVIIDFSQFAGSQVYLVNRLEQENGRGPTERKIDPKDFASDDDFYQANALIEFKVGSRQESKSSKAYGSWEGDGSSNGDPSAFPLLFREFPPIDFSEVRRERIWEFDYDGGLWTINGNIFDPNRVDAGIEQDSAEIWTFRNGGNGWHHPIHSHFTEFLILERDSKPFLRGTIQTELLPQEGEGAQPGGYATRRGLADVFKMEGYKGPEAYEQVDNGLMGTLRRHLESVIKKREQIPDEQGLPTPYLEALDRVQALILELDAEAQQELMDALLSGDYGRMKFRSYAYFRRWAEIFKYFGLGVPVVDRFLGGARRDVALLLPNTEVTVFARWKDFMGKHVMHCHNVVHEDHAMMIRWDIVPQGHGFDTPQHTDQIPQSLGDPVEPERKEHIESHPAGSAHQPNDS